MNEKTELLHPSAVHAKEVWTADVSKELATQKREYYPTELQKQDQWLLWKEERRNGKPTKIPYDVHTGEKASPTDPDTWSSFELACERSSGYSGLGFVFSKDDPYVGIDLDNCRDPETGDVEPWALNIVMQLGSYTEISPSGTGLHIIGKANKPGSNCRTGKLPVDWNARENAGIEIYDKERYFAMSGYHLSETPAEPRNFSEALEKLYFTLWPKQESSNPPSTAPSGTLPDIPDAELIQKALSAENGEKIRRLWEGDHSGFESQSEADQALCNHLAFWTGGEPKRIDRLFRQSGLMRDKWDRRDYRERTIKKALNSTQNHFFPSRNVNFSDDEELSEKERMLLSDCTDAGNASLIALLYGDRLRFDHRQKRWLIWTGHIWKPDEDGMPQRLALKTAKWRANNASVLDNEKAKNAFKWAIDSKQNHRISAALSVARITHPIADAGNNWDSNPWLLGCQNGVIDLRTGKLRNGCLEDRITKQISIAFDESALCPRWIRFLEEIFAGNTELIDYMQRAAGYTLTGSCREQVFFVLYGAGSNGKGVFMIVLKIIFSTDYWHNVGIETFEKTKGYSPHPEAMAEIAGKRYITASETEEDVELNEQRLKALSHGDPISAAFKYRDRFDYTPECKIWLALNKRPRIKDDSHGFWRSMHLIPLQVTFTESGQPGPDKDQELINELKQELPGILAWAVRGCLQWQQQGLNSPDIVKKAVDEYRIESDPLAGFIEECCYVDLETRGFDGKLKIKTPAGELYEEYQKYARSEGIPEKQQLSKQAFGRRMKERHEQNRCYIGDSQKRCYFGIGLLTQQDSMTL